MATHKNGSASKAWNEGWQDIFMGTGAIYTIDSTGHADLMLGDFEVDASPETWPEEFRARRQERRAKGKPVKRLPDHSLNDKTLVIFGPEVSPEQACAALRRVIESIEGCGLFAGRDDEGNLRWEQPDGTMTDG